MAPKIKLKIKGRRITTFGYIFAYKHLRRRRQDAGVLFYCGSIPPFAVRQNIRTFVGVFCKNRRVALRRPQKDNKIYGFMFLNTFYDVCNNLYLIIQVLFLNS